MRERAAALAATWSLTLRLKDFNFTVSLSLLLEVYEMYKACDGGLF